MNEGEIKKLRDVDIMSVSKLFFFFLILSVFAAPIFVSEAFGAYGEDVAEAAIDRAEEAVFSAYDAVLEAEQAEADVSSLLARLNEAGMLLAEAQVAFRLRDFDEAVVSANLCSEIGESVESEADELRVEAYGSRVMHSWLTITGSVVGVVAVVFASFWGWGVFKRRYIRRALKMKPEVAKGES